MHKSAKSALSLSPVCHFYRVDGPAVTQVFNQGIRLVRQTSQSHQEPDHRSPSGWLQKSFGNAIS